MNDAIDGENSKNASLLRSASWLVPLCLILTITSYMAWLGWDQTKTRVPGTTHFEGPYEPWQVVGLAATLIVITAVPAWRSFTLGWVAVAVVTVVLTSAFSVDAATDRSNDGLWLVGAALLAIGTFIGLSIVVALVKAVRQILRRRLPDP